MIFLLFIVNQEIDFEDLFTKATTALVQFQAVRDSATQKFMELGQDSLLADTTIDFLVSKFDTRSRSERHAIKNILKKIGKPAIKGIVKKIDYRGGDEESRSLKQSLWILSEIGGDEIVEPAVRFIHDAEWQIRSGAYTALGKSKSIKALSYILEGLNDSISIVRKSAYYALSQVATEGELSYFIDGLADEFYGVRYAAVEGLLNIGAEAVKPLVEALGSDDTKNYFIIEALKQIEAEDQLKLLITTKVSSIRYSIYQGINDVHFLKEMLKDENHPLLKTFLETKIK